VIRALQYRLRRLARWWADHEEWLLIRHGVRTEPPERVLPPGCTLLRGDELRLCYGDQPRRDARIAARLSDPAEHGLGVACAGRLVYDTWIRIGGQLEPNTGILLDPGPRGGVLLDSWTHPTMRGRGLHAAMLERRLHEAHGLGLIRLEGLVLRGNHAALAAQREAGAEALKWYLRTRRFGRWTTMERPASWHDLDHH
jgi:GNAT superfamily N-acetyltransferase